jgi:hypothetical protein
MLGVFRLNKSNRPFESKSWAFRLVLIAALVELPLISFVYAGGAQGGKTTGGPPAAAFANGMKGVLSNPGKNIEDIGKSFSDKNYGMCGQDCLYQKATSNITYQMDWVQTKINELRKIKDSLDLQPQQKLKQMNSLTNKFCSTVGLDAVRVSHPSQKFLSPEQCYNTYATFMRNWLWKARAALAENEDQIRKLRCDSGNEAPEYRERCSHLLMADVEEIYKLSDGARFTQVPDFLSASEVAYFNEKFLVSKKNLADLYQVTGEEYDNISALDYVKQKLVLSNDDCEVLKRSAKKFQETEEPEVKKADEAIYKACQESKSSLEEMLKSNGGNVAGTEGDGSSGSGKTKLKDLMDSHREKVKNEFKGDVAEDKKSALRKLYDDHHDTSVIMLMGSYDKESTKSWLKVKKVPDSEATQEGVPGGKKKKGEVVVQEFSLDQARKETGVKAGEFKASPPMFINPGGKRNNKESSVIQSRMESGRVEVDPDEPGGVRAVNQNRIINKLDQVSGGE